MLHSQPGVLLIHACLHLRPLLPCLDVLPCSNRDGFLNEADTLKPLNQFYRTVEAPTSGKASEQQSSSPGQTQLQAGLPGSKGSSLGAVRISPRPSLQQQQKGPEPRETAAQRQEGKPCSQKQTAERNGNSWVDDDRFNWD